MADLEINRVLAELRALSARSQPMAAPSPLAVREADKAQPAGFADAMRGAVSRVNATQHEAQRAAEDFHVGRGDLAGTMLKLQQSQLEFRAAVEVRNRAISAYQDIMNMPV